MTPLVTWCSWCSLTCWCQQLHLLLCHTICDEHKRHQCCVTERTVTVEPAAVTPSPSLGHRHLRRPSLSLIAANLKCACPGAVALPGVAGAPPAPSVEGAEVAGRGDAPAPTAVNEIS